MNPQEVRGHMVDNPFFSSLSDGKKQFLTSQCSLNKAVIKKLPLRGIDDSIEGMTFREAFSTSLFISKIKEVAKMYNIDISDKDDNRLPFFVENSLKSDNILLKQFATRLAVMFGNRLGLILLTLRLAEKENRGARPDWDDRHWEYWSQLDTVILVGGLSSGLLGRLFKEQIQYIFDIAGARPYNIVLFDNGTYVASMGCAQRLMADNTTAVVFDMGHTNIKRCIIRKSRGEISEFTPLDSLKSLYVEHDRCTGDELWYKALELHKYIVKSVSETYRSSNEKFKLCDDIVISIANYVAGGIVNSERGGYAKLSALGGNYAKILSEDLSGELHKTVRVQLVHDGTANALYFADYDNSVCISLGTAFGVGFTDIAL